MGKSNSAPDSLENYLSCMPWEFMIAHKCHSLYITVPESYEVAIDQVTVCGPTVSLGLYWQDICMLVPRQVLPIE